MSNKRVRTTPLAERRPVPEEHSVTFTDEQWAAVQALLSEQSRYRQSDMRAQQATSQTERLAGTINGMGDTLVGIIVSTIAFLAWVLVVGSLLLWVGAGAVSGVVAVVSFFVLLFVRNHGPRRHTWQTFSDAWNRHWNE